MPDEERNKAAKLYLTIDTDGETKIEILGQILSEPLIGFEGNLTPSYLSIGKIFGLKAEGVKEEYLPGIVHNAAFKIFNDIEWVKNYMPGSAWADYIDKPSFQSYLPDYAAQAEKAFDDLADKATKFKDAIPESLRPAYNDIFRALMTECIPANFAKAEDYPANWHEKIDAHFPVSSTQAQNYGLEQIVKAFRP